VADYVGDFADADDGDCGRGEIRKANSAAIGSDRRIRVVANFRRIYQRMLGRRISEGGLKHRNSGGNFHSNRDWNFGCGCSLDDGDVDGAIKNNSEVKWNLFGAGI
jgi:hypothetical protein